MASPMGGLDKESDLFGYPLGLGVGIYFLGVYGVPFGRHLNTVLHGFRSHFDEHNIMSGSVPLPCRDMLFDFGMFAMFLQVTKVIGIVG